MTTRCRIGWWPGHCPGRWFRRWPPRWSGRPWRHRQGRCSRSVVSVSLALLSSCCELASRCRIGDERPARPALGVGEGERRRSRPPLCPWTAYPGRPGHGGCFNSWVRHATLTPRPRGEALKEKAGEEGSLKAPAEVRRQDAAIPSPIEILGHASRPQPATPQEAPAVEPQHTAPASNPPRATGRCRASPTLRRPTVRPGGPQQAARPRPRSPAWLRPALPPPVPAINGANGSPPAARPAAPNGEAPKPRPVEASAAWRPLPGPALASPQRPVPPRIVGRLASLAPDPEPQVAFRPTPATPRTAQDFAPDRVKRPVRSRPASRGWRRVVRSASFGKFALGPSRSERRERDLVVTGKTPISTCRRVAIVSRKGGIGKTTTSLMLGHTFALHRGDRVVALDANPDAGSLAYRVHRETDATVTQLLRAAERIRRYSDMRTFTSQSATRLEVLASDDDPTISVALGEPEYREVLHVLEHHYNLILMDTGTGILDSATQGVLRMADQIVVCAAPGIDASRASSLTLDWLDEHGYRDLVSDAVVVINQVRQDRGRELRSVADHFAKRCRAVVKVPWDPHLAEGLEVDVDRLRPETRLAYLSAVAAVARSFALPTRQR